MSALPLARRHLRRRTLLGAPLISLVPRLSRGASTTTKEEIFAFEKARVLRAAQRYLKETPVTITASHSPRSAGGVHDFFSEGDYWWPSPKDPTGPYVQRDGMSNPENFVEHRKALMRLSLQVPALAAGWLVSGEKRYAERATAHLRAWFLDSKTMMSPHLKYAQAIRNKVTGRSIGIIDTIHLVEVVRAISVLEPSGVLGDADRAGLKKWFTDYLTWISTHEYGKDERDAKNNHGTCWVLQASEFARYTGNATTTAYCVDRFKTVLLPNQMAADGSFPLELARTKPYGYSLFQLDVLSGVAQILSTRKDNLWTFTLPDGRGMKKALEFMAPFIAVKSKWPKKPDVMYFDQWPIRHPALVFGGLALAKTEYVDLWKKLNPEPTVDEAIRNYPIRQPVLWLDGNRAA